MSKWFVSIYIATSHKKGISSIQLSKDIGVTQKTAWFILHRIREMLNSMVEIDETYFGGKETNKPRRKRKVHDGYVNKTIVFAILDRNCGVWNKVVDRNDGATLKPIIREHTDKSCVLVSDGFGAYYGLNKEYKHVIVNHAQDEWVNGEYHTNSIEGYFSQLKRGIYGIYHSVSPKHLHRYFDEFSFRYNTRKSKEAERFDFAFITCEKRLKYKDLIASK